MTASAWRCAALTALLSSGAAVAAPVPRYDHILVIIGENETYGPMMSDPATPNLQRLAKTYGVASNFFAEVHPSEGNYVAMVGGSNFGIHDDDAYYCRPGSRQRWCEKSGAADYPDHTVHGRSLVDQLEEKGLTWKGYFQDIPAPGSDAVRDPDPEGPDTGRPAGLYAVKHNGFMNFARVQADPARAEDRRLRPARARPGVGQRAELRPYRAQPVRRHARHRGAPRAGRLPQGE